MHQWFVSSFLFLHTKVNLLTVISFGKDCASAEFIDHNCVILSNDLCMIMIVADC